MVSAQRILPRHARADFLIIRNDRPMRWALNTVLALLFLTGAAVCSGQEMPANPDQTASPADGKPSTSQTQPAKDQVVESAKPADGSIPVPRAGDPFYAPLATPGIPQTFQQRFTDYAVITFGPRALITPALGAAISMLNPPSAYPREWRQGMGAFGRIYGSRLATHTSEQTARFATAAILHEDFRYRRSESKNAFARSFHAIAFTFVDKSDGGHNRIAFSNFAAAAAGGFTPNLYMPAGYNTVSRAETRMAFAFGGFAIQNLTREFAPELFKAVHKLHIPFPRIPVPDWWTPKR
jgi:hypothetical protein